MAQQRVPGGDMEGWIDVRWANEDPNPRAQAREKRAHAKTYTQARSTSSRAYMWSVLFVCLALSYNACNSAITLSTGVLLTAVQAESKVCGAAWSSRWRTEHEWKAQLLCAQDYAQMLSMAGQAVLRSVDELPLEAKRARLLQLHVQASANGNCASVPYYPGAHISPKL